METIKGYKFILENMKSSNGDHTWEVGKWYKYDNKIELCASGFHACLEPREVLEYVYGDKFFLVEARGEIKHDKGNKFVASEMRLVKELPIDKIFKPFAIWCAKQCLVNYEKEYPNDKRPHEAIQAAEDYIDEKITLDELNIKISAAWSARSAAWSAAESAWSAAWSAAESAWSAARSAARSAWSAAWSARSAAESAAESAWSAAWSAAESAQNEKLKELIKPYIEDIEEKTNLILIDFNKSLISKAKKLKINSQTGDIIKFHRDNPDTILCSASNPNFTMGGGLDAQIDYHFPEECKKLRKGKNQIKGNIAFIISVNDKIKAT
ncbi:hypothetical protein GW932_05330, partial [archaeon]|nr:hypothetical protein [archaeon]